MSSLEAIRGAGRLTLSLALPATLAIAHAASAAPRYYHIDLHILANGTEIASPSNVALAGSPVTLTISSPKESYRLVYTLADEITGGNGERGVKLSMKFYKEEKDHWRLLGRPQVGLILGQAGSIEIAPEGSGNVQGSYGITATAKEMSEAQVRKLLHGRLPKVHPCPDSSDIP